MLLVITAQNEAATIMFQKMGHCSREDGSDDVEKIVIDFSNYVNRHSSIGIWKLPENTK